MLAGGLWAGPVHKPSLVPCGKPLVARLKAPTVSHSRGLPKAWVSHKGGTDGVLYERVCWCVANDAVLAVRQTAARSTVAV